jgi:hypothetical protein
MVEALKMNLTVSILEHHNFHILISVRFGDRCAFLVSNGARCRMDGLMTLVTGKIARTKGRPAQTSRIHAQL